MAGLMPQQQAMSDDAAATAPAAPDPDVAMEEPTEQEMAVYNKVVDNIRQIIYGKEGFDAVLKTVEAAPKPIVGIIDVVANAAAAAYISARQAKVPVTNDMMVQAIAETTEEAVDAIEKIGRLEISSEDATNAYVEAVASYGAILEERGMLDQQGATAELQRMMGPQQDAAGPGQQNPMNRHQRRAMEAQNRKGGM